MNLSIKSTLATVLLSGMLGGCYVIPMDQHGNPVYYPYLPPPTASSPAQGGAQAMSLPVRLYPANDLASGTGVVTGTVTNMMTGKGRFNLDYKNEAYTGEATRISDDERRGVASAFSPSGGYMSCEYQMNNPTQGAGTCNFSDGSMYKVHIGR